MPSPRNRGFVLSEFIVSIGVSLLVTVGIGVLLTQMLAAPRRIESKVAAYEIQRNAFSAAMNEQAVLRTIQQNGSMQCLEDGQECAVSAPSPIDFFDQDGNVFLPSVSNPAAGFDSSGRPCTDFDAVSGNPRCPFRIEVAWRPTCAQGATSCLPRQIEFQFKMLYMPGPNADTAANLKMPNFTVMKNVPSPRNPVALVAGYENACVLLASGNVMCWGSNSEGQLGAGTAVGPSSSVPLYVIDSSGQKLANIDQLVAGKRHVCARSAAKRMYCWGHNTHGNLGQGVFTLGGLNHSAVALEVKVPSESDPATLVPLENVKVMHAAHENTCATLEDGDVKCWGWGGGNRLPLARYAFATGAYPASYFLDGGTINTSSSVPISIFLNSAAIPAEIMAAKMAVPSQTKFFLGSRNSCLFYPSDRGLMCWGSNQYSELMQLNVHSEAVPHNVVLTDDYADPSPTYKFWNTADEAAVSPYLTNLSEVHSGLRSTCALKRGTLGHSVLCWGYNNRGQIGNGNIRPSPPATLGGDPHPTEPAWWGWHGSVESTDPATGLPFPTGTESGPNGLPRPQWVVDEGGTAHLDKIQQLSLGSEHACAINVYGRLLCWGMNYGGQLGDGTVTTSSKPVQVLGIASRKAVAVAAGEYFTCTILSDKSVSCWGRNTVGQLGGGPALGAGTYPTRQRVYGF